VREVVDDLAADLLADHGRSAHVRVDPGWRRSGWRFSSARGDQGKRSNAVHGALRGCEINAHASAVILRSACYTPVIAGMPPPWDLGTPGRSLPPSDPVSMVRHARGQTSRSTHFRRRFARPGIL